MSVVEEINETVAVAALSAVVRVGDGRGLGQHALGRSRQIHYNSRALAYAANSILPIT